MIKIMDSFSEVLIVTANAMEGSGCKNFLELNNLGIKISVVLLYPIFEMKLKNDNQKKIIIIDYDSLDEKSVFCFLKETESANHSIILYSQLSSPGILLKAKKLMISGYISKQSSPECLLNCIRVIELGGTYFDSCFSEVLRKISAFEIELTLTQRHIFFEAISSRNKNLKDIAEQMRISKHTLEVHLSNIYEKAGVKNFNELIDTFSL